MTSTDSTFSVLRFVFDTPVPFSQLSSLSVAYVSELGGIAAGAPRIAIVVDTNGDSVADSSFDIQWGPAGSFVDPALDPGNTGNLLALTDVGRYDLTGVGGSVYTDRAAALALAGSYMVHRTSIVIDSFGGQDRRFIIDGVSAASVPEPAVMALVVLGLVGAIGHRRR
jgi:hypothetical protein